MGDFAGGQRPAAALTFDDGPCEQTLTLLDILAEYDAKATFFVTGEQIAKHPDILRRAAREGHEIGVHTWSHPHLPALSSDEMEREIVSCLEVIADVTGRRPALIRPPYGEYNDEVRALCADHGLGLGLWTLNTADWSGGPPERIRDLILQGAAPGSIVICHDWQEDTAQAMREVVPILVREGWALVTFSSLLAQG